MPLRGACQWGGLAVLLRALLSIHSTTSSKYQATRHWPSFSLRGKLSSCLKAKYVGKAVGDTQQALPAPFSKLAFSIWSSTSPLRSVDAHG